MIPWRYRRCINIVVNNNIKIKVFYDVTSSGQLHNRCYRRLEKLQYLSLWSNSPRRETSITTRKTVQYPRRLLSTATAVWECQISHNLSVNALISIKQLITSMLTSLYVTQTVIIITALHMYSAAMTLGVFTMRMEKTACRCGRQQRICGKSSRRADILSFQFGGWTGRLATSHCKDN